MPKPVWQRRIEAWHYGKLVILWSWGGALTYLAYFVVIDLEPSDGVNLAAGFVAMAALALIPAVLSAVTWIWLGGRQKPPGERGDAGEA